MASLLDLISGRMTPEVVQKLAGQAGISATDAKRAIDAIIPAQLSGLASMGSSEAGANRLLSVLKQHQGTESFAQVLLGGDAMQRQAKVGETLQSAVYGNDFGQRISSMASSLGIPQGAASSLMSMIMPVLVGLLGREVRERGLDVVAEELTVEKRRVARGIVRLRTRVETRQEVVDEPLLSEEVAIERVAPGKPLASTPEAPGARGGTGRGWRSRRSSRGTVHAGCTGETALHGVAQAKVPRGDGGSPGSSQQALSVKRELQETEAKETHSKGQGRRAAMPTVIGLFDERAEAMRAYDALLNRGFRSADLHILTDID